jgi:prepilin-type N-terminal cleavage/methylation domain-containing protein
VKLLRLFRLPRRASTFARERTGFTMVELLTVTAIMGTLVRIAVPDLHKAVVKAEAASVVGDFETVRVAVLNYHADHLQWPADGYSGVVPPGLAPYLPDGFSFVRQGYQLDWENWVLPSGLPQHPDTGVLLGISIVTSNRELGQEVVDLLGGGMAHYTLGDRYTFVVERM